MEFDDMKRANFSISFYYLFKCLVVFHLQNQDQKFSFLQFSAFVLKKANAIANLKNR